jgi:hypothetical protein
MVLMEVELVKDNSGEIGIILRCSIIVVTSTTSGCACSKTWQRAYATDRKMFKKICGMGCQRRGSSMQNCSIRNQQVRHGMNFRQRRLSWFLHAQILSLVHNNMFVTLRNTFGENRSVVYEMRPGTSI